MSDLTPEERAHAEEMKRQWLEAFGNDDFIRQAYKAGLIRGWRDVKSVRRHNGNTELDVPQQN